MSEPLLSSSSQDRPRANRSSEVKAGPGSPKRWKSGGSAQRHKARGTEAAVLYGNNSSSSEGSDSECQVSPLRAVRPRHSVPAAPSQKEVPATREVNPMPDSGRESLREAPAPSVFAREEYHSAIRGLGSAKSLLQGPPQPQFSSTPAVSSSNKSALVPEEEYVADDWLEDDLGEMQPKKKRRLGVDQSGIRGEDGASTSRGQNSLLNSDSACRIPPSSSRSLPLKKNSSTLKPQQVKMTQMPGMVRLGRREVNRSHSPTVTDDEDVRPETPPYPQIFMQPAAHCVVAAPLPGSLPPPIRMRVRVQEDVFLIPVPQSEAASCTVSWLCEQAAQRYYQKCGLLPHLSLQKEGALLSPQDLLMAVLHTNEEVRTGFKESIFVV
ncbi:Tonsoku-like protein [Liparis tanakae]|uniref:Tonsoku-like protein n=1 Tax=Liparis tanakae TaxID=230148 RepID=A0A4Z2GNV0_9TELE|nr:Tonsoku-like protein [Liparis tanakae]